MKTNKSFIATLMALPLAAASFTACTSETEDIQMTDAVGISVQMTGTTASRAAYTPAAGTALTLRYGTADGATKSDYTYTNGSWRSSNTLYWQQLSAVNSAYPFFATSPAEPGASGSVSADQSEGYTADDLLMAYTAASYNSTVALELQHLMGMIEVNLSNGEGMTDAELATATLAIDGVKTAYTTAHNAAAVSTLTASGNAANGLKPYQNGTLFQYVAPAQTWTAGTLKMHFTLTINNTPVTYTYATAAEHSLVAGKKTVLNLTVSKTAIEANVTVADWVTNATATGNALIVQTGTADELTGEAGNINELYVTPFSEKQINKMYEGKTEAHTYNKDEEGNWSSENPIYLDNLTANYVLYASTYNLDAEGNRIQDEVTGLYDYLGSDAVTVKGGAAAFALRHLHAQMTVKLALGEGFTADIKDATITTPTMATAAQLGTDAEGNIVMKATEATGTYTVAPAATHLVVNQTLAASSVFTVTLQNGNTYEAQLAETLTLEAGKNTVLTLTLTPSKVGVSATVTAWGEAAASATVQLAGSSSEIGITGITEAGSLVLTYVSNDALSSQSATFGFDGNDWSSTAPLYWDEIAPATAYSFAALFTPNAEGAVEKDYLVGKGTADSHGAQVALGNLTHAMAKFTITLNTGTNMTADELAALTCTVTLKKSSAVAVNADGTTNITLTEAAEAISFTSGEAFYIAPQTLADDNTITLTRENGNQYTLKLNTLTDVFGTGAIEAGQHYDITLTVNETAVGVSATLAPWTEKTGTGTMTPEL